MVPAGQTRLCSAPQKSKRARAHRQPRSPALLCKQEKMVSVFLGTPKEKNHLKYVLNRAVQFIYWSVFLLFFFFLVRLRDNVDHVDPLHVGTPVGRQRRRLVQRRLGAAPAAVRAYVIHLQRNCY